MTARRQAIQYRGWKVVEIYDDEPVLTKDPILYETSKGKVTGYYSYGLPEREDLEFAARALNERDGAGK